MTMELENKSIGLIIMKTTELLIRDKALALGYEKCGIIPIKDLEEYDERLAERLQKVPQSAPFYNKLKYTKISGQYPWAKSVVIAVSHYGKYKVPESLKGVIGKHYVFDARTTKDSDEYQAFFAMEQYLQELGFQVQSERLFGIVGLRNAALKAGLGIIRNNNFFYTQSGSWVNFVAWLTDGEMELKEVSNAKACPESCNKCIGACPSKALSAPFTMSPVSCLSFLTTRTLVDIAKLPFSAKFGKCIYGCDICQEICPMNKGKWEEAEDFPGVQELAPLLTPERIMEMDDAFYKENIQPKFFYLSPDELWKWKVNVLNLMRNNYQESYKPYIVKACDNENDKIRDIALLIRNELNI